MVQSAAEKHKQKEELEKAVGELKQAYARKKEELAQEHKVVKLTPGSSMDEAVRNYERRERVAHDIRKDVVKRKGAGEEGKE